MTPLAKLIARLTRGYIKETGREPIGIDKLRIKMEAAEQLRQANKVIQFPQQRSFKQEIEAMIDDGTIKMGQVDKMNDNVRTRQMFQKSNLNKTEDQIKAEIEANNKKGIASMKKKLDDPEKKATGGRIGFKGGADMGTVADSKGNVGAKSASVSASGDVRTSRTRGPDGPDDRGSNVQNAVQAAINRGVTPRQINRITNPSVIDKIRGSRFNNPLTRGLLRTGLYTLNPSLGAVDFRKAMQAKNLYDYTKDQISNPVNEEDLTLGLITDQQKGIIDKQGNIGKLTGAFDPDSTFDAAKQFDDEGSSGILGIGGRDAEPMTREEFDAYVKEKSYATGGRAAFMAGGMGRRGFLKLLGLTGAGIAGAKTGLMGLSKEPAKQVAKEVVQKSASTPPPYFFKLAEKIKMLGDDATATSDRTIAKTLKSKDGKSTYLLEEDVTSGDTIIKKVNKESDEMITDVEIMEFRKGEVVKGKDGKAMKTPDEYEEVTEANARIEGDVFNDPYYTDGIQVDEIMKEVGEQAPSIKKAGGGIARMLGE